MGRGLGFVALLIGAGIGVYLYSRNAATLAPGGTSPKTAVELTAVRTDLLAIANAERRYWATNGKYASLEELRNGEIAVPTRPAYTYSSEITYTGFRIIASYTGSDPAVPKHIRVDESMDLQTY